MLATLANTARQRTAWILAGILLLALALRLWGIRFGMPYDTHPDEPVYVVSALRIANGEFRIDYPALSPNLHQIFLVGVYGTLYVVDRLLGVYRSAVEFAQSYLADPTPFYVLGRLTSVVLSTATVALVYLLGRLQIGRRGGLFAALFLAVAFIDVRHAHFVEPYALITFLAVACAWMACLFARTGRTRYLLLSSGLSGVAIALRFSVAPILLTPLAAIAFGRWAQVSGSAIRHNMLRLLVGSGAGAAAGFIIGYPGILLDPVGFLGQISLYRGLAGGDAGFWGVILNDTSGWRFYATMLPYGLGWPFIGAALAGLVMAFREKPREWLLVLAFPAGFLLLIGSSSMAFLRYSVPLIPFAALLAAVAVDRLAEVLERRTGRVAAGAAALLACAAVVALPLQRDLLLDSLLAREDTRTIAKRWIEANIPAGSSLAVQWLGPPLSSESDPKPYSQHIYRKEILNPFSAAPGQFSLAEYRDRGFDYLVVSNYIADLPRTNPALEAARQAFYISLDAGATRVAEFNPYAGQEAPPFFFEQISGPITDLARFERPGPTIKIYRVR